MKNKVITYLSILILSVACSDAFEPDVKKYQLELQLLPNTEEIDVSSLAGIEVQFRNVEMDYSFSAISNSEGKAIVDNIESGSYTITASQTISDGRSAINLNGQIDLNLLENTSDTIILSVGKQGSFVIREFYYSNSLTPNGKQYSEDQYIEIFNNTSEVLYADGLSLVEHESYANAPNYWSNIQDSFIVVKMIWIVPGDSTDYPIAPGSGFIMAKDALDHKSDPYGNANCPVDLGDAEFEFWGDKTPTGDINYPATNLLYELWTFKGTDIAFHNRGGSGIALVWFPENRQAYIQKNLITKGNSTSANRYYCKIDNKFVEDAVEVMWNDKVYKRFDESLDAGYTYVEAGSRSGLCVRRKIKEIVNGRTIYQDTNNSTNDFLRDVVPAPRKYTED